MTKISIIVPVYGVEKYLNRCVDSLLQQTLREIEIILINDASLDNCALIMKEYEINYSNKIRCIYLDKNIKQGGARNVGLKVATGKYILFVDSDDWVDPTMCEKMYKSAIDTDSDIVFCDFLKINENNGKEKYIRETGNEIVGVLTTEKKKVLLSMNAFPFSKLVRRDIIMNNNLLFAEGIRYEDLAVVPIFFLYCVKAAKVNEALYNYNVRENSTLNSLNKTYHFERLEAGMMCYLQMKERGFYNIFKEEIEMLFIRSYYFYMLECCIQKFSEPPIKKMREISEKVKDICPNYSKNYYVNKIMDPIYLAMALLNDLSPVKLITEMEAIKKHRYSYIQFYQETVEKVELLLSYCREHSYHIGLWGAGSKGIDFLEVNDGNRDNINYVIDTNLLKKGEILPTGHVINSFDEVKSEIDVIFVCNKNFYGDIYKVVRDYSPEIFVISLDTYLTYNLVIEDFFKTF